MVLDSWLMGMKEKLDETSCDTFANDTLHL